MTQAYRCAGGSVQFVSGGLKGDCLSPSHREFKQGFEDAEAARELRKHQTQAYSRGVKAYENQRLKFDQALQASKVMQELGLSKSDWVHLKATQK